MHSISLIGTGAMARGLGAGWARAGHTITFGSRTPDAKRGLLLDEKQAKVTSHADAVQLSAIVVIANSSGAWAPRAIGRVNALHLTRDSRSPYARSLCACMKKV